MKIEILEEAKQDLMSGYRFYENQSSGLGAYFLDTLFSDIDSLLLYAGTHRLVFGAHRCLARRFPFAIYYYYANEVIRVVAVLDCRRHPGQMKRRLRK